MNTAVTVGTFDGVHRGHLAVISKLLECARDRELTPLAITFDRHPLELIAPQRVPRALTSNARRDFLLKEAGVEPIVVTFDDSLRNLTARDWMSLLKKEYGASLMVVGYDNTFGCDGVGLDISDYRRIGAELGIDVVEAPVIDGISSSAIRRAVAEGEVENAAEMMSRPHRIFGKVVHGDAIGRTLGWPTANLDPAPGIAIPANGVYAATAILPGMKTAKAVVNIGTRPTVGRSEKRTIEAYLIDFKGDLYDKPLTLLFHKKIRQEMKFSSIEALKKRIGDDVKEVKAFFDVKK